ncbi:MAG: Metallophosphoesterase, partial [Parcubacteria group bacterium GW2011_GWA2_42_14]
MTFFKKITKNCFKKISVILNPSIVILNTFALLSVNSVKNLRINSVKNLKFLLKIRVLRFFAVLRMTPKKGFTLIELLLVIAIISFIASIIISAVSSTREKARDAKRIADLNQIEKAIELYRSDNNGNPPGTDGDEYVNGVPNWIPGLIPTHIRIVPSDPIDIDPFQYHYKRQGSDFELAARLERRDNQAARNDGGPGGQKFYEIGSKNNIISTTGSGPTGGGWGGTGLTVSVTSIFPSSGNNSGSASISTIEGTEFAAFGTITVKLIKLGYTDIVGTGFTRVSSTTISGGSFNLTGVAAGQWDVVVIDNGLTGTPSGSLDNGFTVISGPDTLSPTINITSPANAATVQATININADTTDNVGVVKVEFKRDATLTSEVRIFDDTVPAWSAIWDTTTATNGSHTLVAVASDAAGNRATSSVITVTVNNIAPTVTTNPESDLAPTSVTLNGSANPNNLLTTGWFRRWTALQASCIDSGGTRVPTTGGTSLGALNTPQPYSQSVTGLTASTNYWYCAFASNSVGIEAGTVRPFTTPAAGDTIPPSTPTGLTATAISSSQINLAWTASTDNVAVTGYKV